MIGLTGSVLLGSNVSGSAGRPVGCLLLSMSLTDVLLVLGTVSSRFRTPPKLLCDRKFKALCTLPWDIFDRKM